MYDGAMSNVPVRSDNEVESGQAVQRTIVLHIGTLLEYNATEIAAQRCARPHIATRANHHVADDDCIGVNKGS